MPRSLLESIKGHQNWKMPPLAGVAVGCASSYKPKGCLLYSQSGHMPGLWARSPVGAHERQLIDVSLPLFSLPLSCQMALRQNLPPEHVLLYVEVLLNQLQYEKYIHILWYFMYIIQAEVF